MGEVHGIFSLSRPWNSGKPGQMSSCSSLVCDVSRHVDCSSNFESFPLSGECFRPADTDRRISILQAARRCLLAQSARSPVISLSAGRSALVGISWTNR